MKNLYILSNSWLRALKALRPKSWKSAAVDDCFVAVASQYFLKKGAPLDQDDCDLIEKEILGKVYELNKLVGDVPKQERYFVPKEDEVDVTDKESVWFAHIRRPAKIEQVLSPLHVQSANIKSNTLVFPNKERIIAIAEARNELPVVAKKGATRSSWMHKDPLAELVSASGSGVALKYVYSNFDHRPRTYAKKGNAGLTGGEAYRGCFDSEPYDFDSMVQFLFEEKILKRQFRLSPDKSLARAALSDKQCIARHGVALWRAVKTYKEGLDTGSCSYWAEVDLMGSGQVNTCCQINDQGLFSRISDRAHPHWVHVRTIFARHLIERYPEMDTLDALELDMLLKLVLSPLQYGAGKKGVFQALTGVEYTEEIEEIDWELFEGVNKTLKGLFPSEDVDVFVKDVQQFAKLLHKEYCSCFSQIKKLMDSITKAYGGFLEAGQIPEYTSYSGQVNYGLVGKRGEAGEHWAKTSVLNEFGKTVPFKAKVCKKIFKVKYLKPAAFSWFMHGIDGEIISLFTVLAHEKGISHFTNHDAVYIRLCDWDIVQSLMAHCIITVGAYKVFQQAGWDTIMPVSSIDCHWETNTPEVLV